MDRRLARGPIRPCPLVLTLLCALVLASWVAGCRRSGDERLAGTRGPAVDAEWDWLQQTKRSLDAQRARLESGEGGAASKQTAALAREFNRRLVDFINADPPVQGEPLRDRQQAAIRMKSDEDIVLAREFIERGGDYQRAIDIYREALVVDPGNSRLRTELARAQAQRYMTRQTFAQVQEGMDQEAVRRLLGQPNLHNVRAYPERGVVGWFYPRDASGAAAAVWFHLEEGRYTVYLRDFDALRPLPAEPPQVRPVRPAPTAV